MLRPGRRAMIPLALLLAALLLPGCAGGLIATGIFMQCGAMPMGPSDCEPKRPVIRPMVERVVE